MRPLALVISLALVACSKPSPPAPPTAPSVTAAAQAPTRAVVTPASTPGPDAAAPAHPEGQQLTLSMDPGYPWAFTEPAGPGVEHPDVFCTGLPAGDNDEPDTVLCFSTAEACGIDRRRIAEIVADETVPRQPLPCTRTARVYCFDFDSGRRNCTTTPSQCETNRASHGRHGGVTDRCEQRWAVGPRVAPPGPSAEFCASVDSWESGDWDTILTAPVRRGDREADHPPIWYTGSVDYITHAENPLFLRERSLCDRAMCIARRHSIGIVLPCAEARTLWCWTPDHGEEWDCFSSRVACQVSREEFNSTSRDGTRASTCSERWALSSASATLDGGT